MFFHSSLESGARSLEPAVTYNAITVPFSVYRGRVHRVSEPRRSAEERDGADEGEVPRLIHAERSDRPFVGRRLLVCCHPFQVQREAILRPVLSEDHEQRPQWEHASERERDEWDRVARDMGGAHERASGLRLHPVVLQEEVADEVGDDE